MLNSVLLLTSPIFCYHLFGKVKTCFLMDEIPPYSVALCPSLVWASAWEPRSSWVLTCRAGFVLPILWILSYNHLQQSSLLRGSPYSQWGKKKKKILQGPTDPLYFETSIHNDKRYCTQPYNAPLTILTVSPPVIVELRATVFCEDITRRWNLLIYYQV